MVLNITSIKKKKTCEKHQYIEYQCSLSITSFYMSRIVERHHKYVVIASLNVNELNFFYRKNYDENQNDALRYNHKIFPDNIRNFFFLQINETESSNLLNDTVQK